jgi:hypothetical protein
MEYRVLAELVRQVKILAPLGGGRPFPRTPAHLAVYGSLDQTWMYWQMRAIARSVGLPTAAATPNSVKDRLASVGGVVQGQLKFHRLTEGRSHRMWHRLHLASILLFALTFISILIHLLSHAPPPWAGTALLDNRDPAIGRWLILIAATLPALGAALAGIVNQGEFARLAKRSASMVGLFERFAAQITTLRDGDSGKPGIANPKLSDVIPVAEAVTTVMVDEVADWRVVVTERPVEIE